MLYAFRIRLGNFSSQGYKFVKNFADETCQKKGV